MTMNRPRKTASPEHLDRLARAAAARHGADAELRAAVLAASAGGASVRVIAEAGRLSTATVRDWVKAARDS